MLNSTTGNTANGVKDVQQNFNFGTFQFNIIYQGRRVPGYWEGGTYHYPVDSNTGVVKDVR
ncbi:MAG: hypothetical protein KA319_01870 [Ferruginibacter sp.]|nr:hypothetical protein [Ferruginibacter sp.]